MDMFQWNGYKTLNKKICQHEKYNSEFKSVIIELYQTERTGKDLSHEYNFLEVAMYK